MYDMYETRFHWLNGHTDNKRVIYRTEKSRKSRVKGSGRARFVTSRAVCLRVTPLVDC